MKPEPPDAELERLSAILERSGGKRSMNLEKLDGFIAALGRVDKFDPVTRGCEI